MEKFIDNAGVLDVTAEQLEMLRKPINKGDIAIKPNGIIYAPWHVYANKMTDTFGLAWTLLPDDQAPPKWHKEEQCVRGAFWLFINGKPMGWAVGEQEKTHSNMGIGEMVEGAKSNALMRVCKGLGISTELWDRTFIDAFIDEYCETYTNKRGKILWKLKATPMPKDAQNAPASRPTSKPKGNTAVDRVKETFSGNVGGEKKTGKKDGKYYKFLGEMKTRKEQLGDEAYYSILKGNGYSKSSEILDRGEQVIVWKAMGKAVDNSVNPQA